VSITNTDVASFHVSAEVVPRFATALESASTSKV
jgi:hypothetical protein